MVARLDAAPPIEALVRTFPLQNADATHGGRSLNKLFTGGVFKQGGLAGATGDKTAKITVTTDTRSNTIFVSAKKEWWPLIENLVQRMDSPEAPFTMVGGVHRSSRCSTATRSRWLASCRTCSTAWKRPRPPAAARPTTPQPIIIADPRTNSLLVSATPAGVQRVQTLVTRLDQPAGLPTAEIRVYPLKEASADHMDQVISDLFTRRNQVGGGGGGGGAGPRPPAAPAPPPPCRSTVIRPPTA